MSNTKKGKHQPRKQGRTSPNISLVPSKPEVVWIIEPHDPLIVRDGRPFGPNPSARAVSLAFPFPSTTTGGVRTRGGLKTDGTFDVTQINHVKQIKVRGPLLVQLAQSDDKIKQWLVPAPADALLLEEELPRKDFALCKRLVPLKVYAGAETNLNTNDGTCAEHTPATSGEAKADLSTNAATSLKLVGPVQPDPSKPSKEAPPYWYWNEFQKWLLDPSTDPDGKILPLADLGLSGPQRERRLHVSMNPETLTAQEGALFETSGLEFTSPGKDYKRLSGAQRLALAVAVDKFVDKDKKEAVNISAGLASLGGERRMVSWRSSDHNLPTCPKELPAIISNDKACRVLLLTPAYFKQGYRPNWLVKLRDGVQPSLEAIAIQRPQVVSGWDLEKRSPKPTRRLAPAGTVLFLSLAGDDDKAIEDWVKSIWMECVSDNQQDRNDGFGLAVLGSWSDQPEDMREAK